MSLMSFRDPLLTGVLSDVVDPFDLSNELLPMTTSGGSRNRGTRRDLGRLMNIDAFETDLEFKVICEVSEFEFLDFLLLNCFFSFRLQVPGVDKEKLDVSVDNFLLSIKCVKQTP
jgi:HSP20 family molecular chaperone IbpA